MADMADQDQIIENSLWLRIFVWIVFQAKFFCRNQLNPTSYEGQEQ